MAKKKKPSKPKLTSKKAKPESNKSIQVRQLLSYLDSLKLTHNGNPINTSSQGIVSEYHHKGITNDRKWRFDITIPAIMLVIEYEGGNHWGGKSRHSTGTGFTNDCIKYSHAAACGWSVLRFTANHVKSGECFPIIEHALKQRGVTW